MTSHYDFFATAPKYTEGLLLDELVSLDADNAKETVGGVSFSGTLETAYKVCLWSRIANRVLLRLNKTKISGVDDLYEAVYQIDWQAHFDADQSFVIDFTSNSHIIKHSQFAAQKCKDAIVDQFRHQCGSRPDVDKANPDIRINVHVKNQLANISIDLSGHSLHQRGYRKATVAAPLKENLAAAMLVRSGWTRDAITLPLIDPMCGSGTLVIEAALIASNTAPGLLRNDFGFDEWKGHNKEIWESLREKAKQERKEVDGKNSLLVGFDIDAKAIAAATENAENAGVNSLVSFRQQALPQLRNENYGKQGYLISNPPYGERLSDNEKLRPLYETLGRQLKAHFCGWKASIITSDAQLSRATGLFAKRKNKLYNGNLLCTIYHFDLSDEHEKNPGDEKLKTGLSIDKALQNRLLKNYRRLKKWADRQQISCYRVYDADLPEFNFALDLYQSDKLYVVFQEYAAPTSIGIDKVKRRSRVAQQTVIQTLQIDASQLFYKQRKKQAGTEQYEKLQQKSQRHIVTEGDCRFYVNFEDYLDTGLFLDHRITRQMIHELARGKSFLNLFCYTGTASVHAALGGAKKTTSVDLSSTYLSWCEDNFSLNNIPLDNHRFIKANCMEWLKAEKANFDLIFVDPPTFSNSKSMNDIFDVQRDYLELLNACENLLTKNGKIIFSTNFRKFSFDEQKFTSLTIEDISKKTLPEDFARNSKIHQCWILSKE